MERSISVFGSAMVRVPPDVAAIRVSLSRVKKKPADAFADANLAAKQLYSYLKSFGVDDVCSSRVHLSRAEEYRNGETKFLGYRAQVGYSILTRDLERIDELLIGVIAAGADQLGGVDFQTTRLKSIRENVRKEALLAARRKAEIYADAAGVTVGSVIEIKDENPGMVSGESERGMHVTGVDEDSGCEKAIDPGAIVVGAAVSVVFEIES